MEAAQRYNENVKGVTIPFIDHQQQLFIFIKHNYSHKRLF